MTTLWQRVVLLGICFSAPVLARDGLVLPVLPHPPRPNIQIERLPERVCWHNNARYSLGARIQTAADSEWLVCGNLSAYELNGAVGWLSPNQVAPVIAPQGSRTISSQGQ